MMKREEFEWLKTWIWSILVDTGLDPDQKYSREKIIELATKRYPPPIDEEKLPYATTLHCHKHHTNFEPDSKCPECEKEAFVPDPFKNPACFGCGVSHTGRMEKCKTCDYWDNYWLAQGLDREL